jgi:hypothetical protein
VTDEDKTPYWHAFRPDGVALAMPIVHPSAAIRFAWSVANVFLKAVNAGLAKLIMLRETWRLRFEATLTNVLNHTNFAPPTTDISSPASFGALTTAQTAESAGNRTGQVALRLDF